MAENTPTTVTLIDGLGRRLTFAATFDLSQPPIYSLQSTPRVMGAQVDEGNPMPVADAASGAALGTTADQAWTAGTGTMIGLLKAVVGFLSGGATSANQTAGNTALTAIATAGSTAALQTTGNTSLAAIATSAATGATAAGQASALTPATAAATALGTPGDAAWSGAGAGSLVALVKAVWALLSGTLTTTLAAGANAIGTIIVTPTALAAAGSVPVATAALASSLALKAAPGNLYRLDVTTTNVAGWVMVFDATALPANGAVTPKYCWPLQANPGSMTFDFPTPAAFANGIVVAFSSTGPFVLTASATAFITGQVK